MTDRGVILARIHGTLSRHAPWKAPEGPQLQAALTDINTIAAGDDSLLNELAVRFRALQDVSENELFTTRYEAWVAILVAAGAATPTREQWKPIADEHASRSRRCGQPDFAEPHPSRLRPRDST